MKRLLMFAALVAVAIPVSAQERLADQLRRGITEEEMGKSLDKAIEAYQSIVARYDEDRTVAGTALLRLADCYRKTGKREQAIATYRRVVREFGDQKGIVESSRQQLAALGVPAERPREVVAEPRARTAAPESVRSAQDIPPGTLGETRLALQEMDTRIRRAKDMVAKGLIAPSDVESLEAHRQLLVEKMRQQEREIALNRQLMTGVQKEITLVEAQIAAYERKIEVGTKLSDDPELLQLRRDLIALQQKLAELRAGVRR